MSYNVGETVLVYSEFRAIDTSTADKIKKGARILSDPLTVTCTVTDPLAAATVYTYPADITRVSVGFYYFQVIVNSAGTWELKWEGTGSAAGVSTKQITVV